MRIAYVSLHWPRPLKSGVGKKIAQQISLWREAGHEAQFFMHSHAYPENEPQVEGNYFRYEKGKSLVGMVRQEFGRSTALKRLLGGLSQYRPDIIYLRWGTYVFPIERLGSVAPFVVEINTNDVQQHQLLGGVLHRYNLLTRSILLSRSAGLVCASHELAEMIDFKRFHKPAIVIGNGYNLDDVQPYPAPCNRTPHLLFVGSPDSHWHGVDKLLPFARRFPDLEIHIVGYETIPDSEPLPGNLHLHGYLSGQDYKSVLQNSDAAFGSLGLHRIGLREASPLKTRESLAYGLPLIIAYRDTDLDGVDTETLLHIPNQEDNLVTHGKEVQDFAWRVLGMRVDRQIIAPYINWRKKEEERLEFFKNLVKAQHGSTI
jgi:glycosyltransferase involved in cell wall biosynthesis